MSMFNPFGSFVRILAGATIGCALAAAPVRAEETKMRFAYLLADSMLPIMVAQKEGAYAKAGIDLEMIEVQGGPAVVAALAAGEADIGYAAPVPPINARLNGVNVKMILTLAHELAPDQTYIWLVASAASGIKTMADVKGRKISFNANGALCELTWRDHMMEAGLSLDDVEPVVLPFPQQEAALEQGTIDAACTINPFYASISANKAIGSTLLASGMLADLKEPVISDVIFATDDYIAANRETLKKFAAVTDSARKELLADRGKLESAGVEFLGLAPETAKHIKLPIVKTEMSLSVADVQKLLDAMHKTGILPEPVKADDMVDNFAD